MMNDIKGRENLVRDLGIFELRGLARKLGVVSPTTKKREELIDFILEAMNNNGNQDSVGKRKGRPYKELSSVEEILNLMTKQSDLFKTNDYNSVMSFAQETPKFLEGQVNTKIIELKGYARLTKDEYISFYDLTLNFWAFIRKDNKCYNLIKEGDFVCAKAKPLASNNQFEVIEILKINDTEASLYTPNQSKNGEEIISNENIFLGIRQIKKGRRNSLLLEEDIYENNDFEKLCNYCNNENIEVVVLGVNNSYENQIFLKNIKNIRNFSTSYGTEKTLNLNSVIDAINYVEQITRNGKSSLMFVIDIMEIVRTLDKCFNIKPEDSKEMTNSVISKMMSLGKAYSNGVSTTLLLYYRENDIKNDYLQNEILRISKPVK